MSICFGAVSGASSGGLYKVRADGTGIMTKQEVIDYIMESNKLATRDFLEGFSVENID
jgi:hypothetical protein